MDRLDVSYERACMETTREVYYTKILDSPLNHNDCHDTPFSSKQIQESVSRFMEEEEKYSKRNFNNVTMDALFQYPVTINTQRKDANVTN